MIDSGSFEQAFKGLSAEEKLVLFAIGSFGISISTKIKIQKLLFLTVQIFPDLDDLFSYDDYVFGPHSERMDAVVKSLMDKNILTKDNKLTVLGSSLLERITIKEPLSGVIHDFKEFLHDMSDDEIMTYIYTAYPEYQKNSEKWDELKFRRVECAIRLFSKKKISISRAVKMADMDMLQFDELLKAKNVRWRID